MFDPMMLARTLINQNPNIANNPRARDLIQVIQNGDSKRGQEIAENLCKTYGTSKEDAVNMASDFFRNQFHIPL